ncbi:MAG: DUF1461 domain-containing protein [Clostridia bacterium]|nr:DUF1461 domain-containing protein [Clostridia bacterium]
MRNTIGKLLVIFAVLILLFSAAFQTVSLILRDTGYLEKKYRELNVGETMEQKMSTPDLAGATEVLLDYMRGERANIKYAARVNGVELKDVFYHEKEVVHMAEVQTLWLGLDGFSRYGAIAAGVMLIIGIILPEKGKRRAVLANGMFWACGIFGGVLVFFGIWALLDFSSFWTVFHFLIFPASLFQFLSAGASQTALNELNWMLPSDSIMVNMLTPIFPSLVLRCAIAVAAEIGVVLLAAVVIRFAWRKAEKKPAPLADVVVIEHDANEPVPIEGPDLVLAHKLRNAPVSMREELLRRAQNGEPLDDEPEPPAEGSAAPEESAPAEEPAEEHPEEQA